MTATEIQPQPEKVYKWNIVWKNVFGLTLLHILGIYGMFMKKHSLWPTFFFSKGHSFLIGVGVTAGIHRYFCHRAHKASKAYEIMMTMLASSIAMESIYVWCRDHRVHHRYSETDADPYNARRGFFFSHMGWLFIRKHPEVVKKGKLVDLSDLESNWVVMLQHKYYYVFVTIFAFLIPTFLPCILFNENVIVSFALNMYKTVYTLHVVWFVNSLAHLFGKKPYDSRIGPTEAVVPIALAFGEGFHNYHHTFPWDYKASEYKFDSRNFACIWIDFWAYFGLVKDRKEAPKELVDEYVKKHGGGKRVLRRTPQNLKWWRDWIIQAGIFFLY